MIYPKTMEERVTPGKYAMVRDVPSQDPAVLVARAQASGLTGLVFRVNDPARLETEWLPDAAGDAWQRVQAFLATGLDALVAAGIKIGLLFEGTRGAYEVPATEGASYAGVLRILDPVGMKIDFYMTDITGEARWAVLDTLPGDTAPYGTAAKKLCHLAASARWSAVGRPRPIYFITPAVDMATWPGVLWAGSIAGQEIFAPGYEWSCLPVMAAAHRVDPNDGTNAITEAWTWHATVGAWQQFRGENVFDIRAGAVAGSVLKWAIDYVVGGFLVELPTEAGSCWWRPTCGLVVVDDLDAIEAQGLQGDVAAAATPTLFWDLLPNPAGINEEGDPWWEEPCASGGCGIGTILWPLQQPVLPLTSGVPWELDLAVENWRNTSAAWFRLEMAPGDSSCREDPCVIDWIQNGGKTLVEICNDHNHVLDTRTMSDPLTGLQYMVLEFVASGGGGSVAFYHFMITAWCME